MFRDQGSESNAISTGLEKDGSLPQKAASETGKEAQKVAIDKARGALKGGYQIDVF